MAKLIFYQPISLHMFFRNGDQEKCLIIIIIIKLLDIFVKPFFQDTLMNKMFKYKWQNLTFETYYSDFERLEKIHILFLWQNKIIVRNWMTNLHIVIFLFVFYNMSPCFICPTLAVYSLCSIFPRIFYFPLNLDCLWWVVRQWFLYKCFGIVFINCE